MEKTYLLEGTDKIHVEGKFAYLAEIEPKYFPYVIEWRNNPDNNRFLNQPFALTLEKQTAWYEKYVKDNTQGMMIMVARDGDVPFGTVGWTDYSTEDKVCISGRLLVGNKRYSGSRSFIEASLLFNDFLYEGLDIQTIYAHVAKKQVFYFVG